MYMYADICICVVFPHERPPPPPGGGGIKGKGLPFDSITTLLKFGLAGALEEEALGKGRGAATGPGKGGAQGKGTTETTTNE